jgi:hypothetical protein
MVERPIDKDFYFSHCTMNTYWKDKLYFICCAHICYKIAMKSTPLISKYKISVHVKKTKMML